MKYKSISGTLKDHTSIIRPGDWIMFYEAVNSISGHRRIEFLMLSVREDEAE